jgi:hypothetical protein
MAKINLLSIITLDTLETTIEYMFISSILDRICKMTKKSLGYPKIDIKLDPLAFA